MTAAASGGDDRAFELLVADAGFATASPWSEFDHSRKEPALDERQREAVLLTLEHCAGIAEASPRIVEWLLRQCHKASAVGKILLDTSDSELMAADTSEEKIMCSKYVEGQKPDSRQRKRNQELQDWWPLQVPP